jgi:hypothetical protein
MVAWTFDSARRDSIITELSGAAGVSTFPAAAAPTDNVSLAEVLRELYEQSERVVSTAAAVMVTGTTKFTIAGGPIVAIELISVCVTANDATASTLQWSANGTDGAATTFTGASASLASAAAGVIAVTHFTAVTTAPVLMSDGVGISRPTSTAHGMIIPAGIITHTIAVGSTTGTWTHHLRYRPMARGVTVT